MADDFSLIDDFSDEDNSSGQRRALIFVLVGLGLALIACIAALAIAATTLDLSNLSDLFESNSAVGGGGESQLVVNNNSGGDVCYLFVSPSDSSDWGDDVLGVNTILAAGSSYTVKNIAPGQYDFLAERCAFDDASMDYGAVLPFATFAVNIGAAGTWSIGPQSNFGRGAATFVVNNDTGSSVCAVYFAPETEVEWGANMLGPVFSAAIDPGNSFEIRNVPRNIYDLLIIDCDNNILVEEFGISVEGTIIWNLSAQGDQT